MANLSVATLGALTAFLFWSATSSARAAYVERHAHSTAAGRSLRLWAYGPQPCYAGFGAVASGFVATAGHEVHGAILAGIFALGLALAMIGLTVIGQARRGGPVAWRACCWRSRRCRSPGPAACRRRLRRRRDGGGAGAHRARRRPRLGLGP